MKVTEAVGIANVTKAAFGNGEDPWVIRTECVHEFVKSFHGGRRHDSNCGVSG